VKFNLSLRTYDFILNMLLKFVWFMNMINRQTTDYWEFLKPIYIYIYIYIIKHSNKPDFVYVLKILKIC
jgi:hypothetical protein